MAGGKSNRNGRKKAQLSLFDEKVLADMEPAKDSTEEISPADPTLAEEPSLPAEIPAVDEPAKEQAKQPEQTDKKEAAMKAKREKEKEARLAALWKARGKK